MREPFHAGERAIQEQVGDRAIARMHGQAIADRIPAGGHGFVAQQRACVLGWATSDHRPWATVLGGPPGFAAVSADGATVQLQLHDDFGVLAQVPPFSATAAMAAMRSGDHLAVLFIDLATRRRLRMNGPATWITDHTLAITVEQACPLCPKYMQRRYLADSAPTDAPTDALFKVASGQALTDELSTWISAADTCFVASAHPDRSADVSHRGGRVGFIRQHAGVLRIPDYPGNKMYNTLGNFALLPRAGITIVDFSTNRQLQMTGDVRLDLRAPTPDDGTGGTGRWWEFRLHTWRISPLNHHFTWTYVDASPVNP